MKTRNVIAPAALPTRSPLVATVVGWLLLDRLGVSGWPLGVYWTLAAILWIAFVCSFWKEQFKTPVGFGEDT